jgi:hypothetical protein
MDRIYSATGFVFLLLFLALPTESKAAALSGKVVDSNSAAVSGARVHLRRQNVTFEVETVSNQDGKFYFDNVSEATYLLSIRGPGFSTYETTVALHGAETKNLTVTLQPATIAETVVITSSHLAVDSDSLSRIPGSIELIDAPTLENSRPQTSSEVLRKVDPSGSVSFAGTNYRVGNQFKRQLAGVRLVGDTVQITIEGTLVRTHKARHDKSKEFGALAQPDGKPRRRPSVA